MQKVETKFGTIYIEDLYDRVEADRIKIFDSNQRYLDYYSMEIIDYIAECKRIPSSDVLQAEIDSIEHCDNITDLVGMLTSDCEMCTRHWENVARFLEIDSPTEVENDYVNKIGDYYIVVVE